MEIKTEDYEKAWKDLWLYISSDEDERVTTAGFKSIRSMLDYYLRRAVITRLDSSGKLRSTTLRVNTEE